MMARSITICLSPALVVCVFLSTLSKGFNIVGGETCLRYEKHACSNRLNYTITPGAPAPVFVPSLAIVGNKSLCVSSKGRLVANWPVYCDEMLDVAGKVSSPMFRTAAR